MNTNIRYSLVRNENNVDCYQNHLHFLCDNCGKTICLDMMPVPLLSLPAGFSGKETEVIIKGTCKDVNNIVERICDTAYTILSIGYISLDRNELPSYTHLLSVYD